MKHKWFGTVAATVACMGMILPPSALAAAPAKPVTGGNDIALREGGLLVGQVVDAARRRESEYAGFDSVCESRCRQHDDRQERRFRGQGSAWRRVPADDGRRHQHLPIVGCRHGSALGSSGRAGCIGRRLSAVRAR